MRTLFILLALIAFGTAKSQFFTYGGYAQLYWDWRPDIADSCYEFTFIKYKAADSPAHAYAPAINLYSWDDCNFGKNYINVDMSTGTASNAPLHDTLYRMSPVKGIRDTFCGFIPLLVGNPPNFAEDITPMRSKVVYKGLVYLPEKCKNWHFTIGAYYDLTYGYAASDRTNIIYNHTDPDPPFPYTNVLSNIDSIQYSVWNHQVSPSGGGSCGFYGCSFNNVDFPNNSSPRFLSAPIYDFQIQKPVEFNPGPFDPDHDSIVVSITDTLKETNSLVVGLSGSPLGFYYPFFAKTDSLGNTYSELFTWHLLYAPLPGQTGANPLRYTPQNPFNTDNTWQLHPNTGKTTFTAKSIMEPALFYTAKDYRNNVFVSESYCVNQFTILADGRLPSYMRIDTASLQGISSFNNQGMMIGCPGNPISFDAYVKLPGGPTVDLIVRTTADTTVPGNGVCNITGLLTDSVHLKFSWTPPLNAKGLYNVFVTAKDSNCNAPYHEYVQVYTWSFHIDSCLSPLGTESISQDSELTLYPNPTSDRLTISGSDLFSSVKIMTMLSELVCEHKTKPTKHVEISLAELPAGIYLVCIDGKYIRKLVIQK